MLFNFDYFFLSPHPQHKVYITMASDEEESPVRWLCDSKRPIFKRGMVNRFLMATPRCVCQTIAQSCLSFHAFRMSSYPYYLLVLCQTIIFYILVFVLSLSNFVTHTVRFWLRPALYSSIQCHYLRHALLL